MHDNKNKPSKTSESGGHTSDKEYGGFYTSLVRVGDYIYVGDSLIYFKTLRDGAAIICIRAPKEQKIIKKSGENGQEE